MTRKRLIAGHTRHLGGWRPDKPDHRDRVMMPLTVELPPTHVLPQVVPVFDQGAIGSCTANMACAMYAWLEDMVGKKDVVFSRLFVYAMTRIFEGTPLAEDSGAEIRNVMKTLAKHGACLEQTWPYGTPEARFVLEPSEAAKAEGLDHQALFYYRCSSLKALKSSLVQGYPVGFGFSVPENMMTDEAARTGIVRYPADSEGFDGAHAVTAWGYDDAFAVGEEKGAVLCLNSWGTSWGLQGYFWLPYRFFFEHLADDAWTLRRIEL